MAGDNQQEPVELVTHQSLQNFCDLHKLELRENRYNQQFMSHTGFTVKYHNHAAHVPGDWTIERATTWLLEFMEKHSV